MKKWFKDDTLVSQPLSREIALTLYKVPEDKLEEVFTKERFVVLRTIRTPTHSIQIAFNTKPTLENNVFVAYAFDLDDELVWAKSFHSHTLVPPVWDRLFGGMDYLDWLSIQHQLKREPLFSNLEISEDLGEKANDFSFYFAQEPDAYERLQRGEGYHPLCVFAVAKPELVQHAKEFVKREYGA